MSSEKIQKHILLNQTHIDILDDTMNNIIGVNSHSEAIRYAILCLAEQNANSNSKDVERKINSMSKNIDILIEMTAGGFDTLDVKALGKSEETYIYKDGVNIVENKIQRATTIKSNYKKTTIIEEKPKEKSVEPIKRSHFY